MLDREPALAAKATHTGNPVRPAVIAAAATPYPGLEPDGRLRLLVFGGSQGARVMADVVPAADRTARPGAADALAIVQQARDEDGDARRAPPMTGSAWPPRSRHSSPTCRRRIAAAHLVIARSGASTVAELAAIGRPSILVPLPGALDQDQLANATVLQKAGGALLLTQDVFTPVRLGREIAALAAAPERLAAMAAAAKGAGRTDAAERLADLVMKVAGLRQIG